jgi:hypothetical protein
MGLKIKEVRGIIDEPPSGGAFHKKQKGLPSRQAFLKLTNQQQSTKD